MSADRERCVVTTVVRFQVGGLTAKFLFIESEVQMGVWGRIWNWRKTDVITWQLHGGRNDVFLEYGEPTWLATCFCALAMWFYAGNGRFQLCG